MDSIEEVAAKAHEPVKVVEEVWRSLREVMETLAERWDDEREFEDINEYGKVIAQHLPANVKLLRMKKRPFGFDLSIDGTARKFNIYVSSKRYGAREIR